MDNYKSTRKGTRRTDGFTNSLKESLRTRQSLTTFAETVHASIPNTLKLSAMQKTLVEDITRSSTSKKSLKSKLSLGNKARGKLLPSMEFLVRPSVLYFKGSDGYKQALKLRGLMLAYLLENKLLDL